VKHPITRLVVMASAALAVVAHGSGVDVAGQDAQVTYEIQPLASLGGISSRGNGINDAGMVSGFSNISATARRAAVWFHGEVFQIDPLGGTNSSVAWSGKTSSGLVVGITQTSALQTRADGWSCRIFFPGPDSTKYTCIGFVWEGGQMAALPTLEGDNAFAASANSLRQVVGWAETGVADSSCIDPADRGFVPVLWDLNRNQTVPLPPFGDDSAGAATAISDRGHIVGISGTCDQSVGRRSARHAVMWHDGTVTDLGNVGGDTWNTPTAITRRGDIVVGFGNSPGAGPDELKFRAWLWTERDDIACPKRPGTNICDLGTLDPGGTAEAWGVNERGQVVGTACPPVGNCKAFIWENGRMKNLNEVKGTYPHHLENAMDINYLGQITGRAITSSGREAIVAIPSRSQ
jgi:probable HAF family extracellular repeat protein